MLPRGCSSSHFIRTIQNGVMKRVHNTDSHGRPLLKFKKLEDIYQSADAERTPLPFAERKTRSRSGFVGDDEPGCQSYENDLEEMTLSQLRKKCKRKKRKVSEYVFLTPKVEDDDPDLSEPLCKFRVKGSKRSPSKSIPTNESSPTSSRDDISTVTVKIEAPDMENFECNDTTFMEKCGFNEGPVCNSDNMESDNEDDDMQNVITPMHVSEMDKEEYVHHSLSIVSSVEDDSSFEDLITRTSDCFQSQQTSEQVGHICDGQDLESTIGDDHCCVDIEQSSDYLCLPWKSHFLTSSDEHDVDGVFMKVKSPICEEKQDLTSVNIGADLHSLISDNNNNSYDSQDVFILQDPSLVPANDHSEVKLFDHTHLTDVLNEEASEVRNSDCLETRFPERLPLTRKAISPKSQEKLRLAMNSAEFSDDVDRFKCKEKLNFEEQNENKFSSTTSDTKDNEPNLQPHQSVPLSQNKVFISSKQLLKRPKNYKKGSPPNNLTPKGCLDGPRSCRSLPRVSTGCTSIQGCSESAIAFSERQMHDIESLASKLMSELNSMKAIVENKLLFEEYRSTPLNNEADEVKSAIKSATKTEEMARKWLSMMARDCNRFCKIMKLNQDDKPSGNANQGKPLPVQKERKRISFADEAGGTLCDIKVYCMDQESLELNEKLEPSLA
ncbi:uncharacterized protein [Rutidosis leptorrhynchoides]|uniref:uncharacterized protein n=1 Tax=Rutidosis leptorrhynchoides TaxID=125765 RepID=UPI003A99DD39